MRIDKVYIEEFKNLIDFNIDLDETKMHSVLLGQNAAGKSNFLEAIVKIFRDLDLGEETEFNYEIHYKCNGKLLKAIGGPKVRGTYQLYIGTKENDETVYSSKPVSKSLFKSNKDDYLPKHIFSYYSGTNLRLLKYFDKHQKNFRNDLLKDVDRPIRRLFHTRNIHSHFVLMAFFSFSDSKIKEFLSKYLDIVGLESVLFVFKEPNWIRNKDPKDFWGAKGLVRNFLEELWDISLAPITTTKNTRVDFVKKTQQQQMYLYLSNEDKLQKLADKYANHSLFFKILESTYVSDLIEEVRIKVKKRNVNGDITFKELSEGEQQLLTVLGLIRFTKENDSLFLLDEPDTHLNPLWKWSYMNLLEDIVDEKDNSQILMTTHDPLVIGGLTKEEIRLFQSVKKKDKNGNDYQQVETFEPNFDPKGLGVAGILTSEFFNLPSTLDEDTLEDLNERNRLVTKKDNAGLSEVEREQLNELFLKLSDLGINTTDRDPMYQKFISAISQREEFQVDKVSKADRAKQNQIALEILDELFNEIDDK